MHPNILFLPTGKSEEPIFIKLGEGRSPEKVECLKYNLIFKTREMSSSALKKAEDENAEKNLDGRGAILGVSLI